MIFAIGWTYMLPMQWPTLPANRGYILITSERASFSVMKTLLAAAVATVGLMATTQSVTANPKMVIDVKSGQVIAHEDAFRKWYPASLTKLMTAYITFADIRAGRLNANDVVTISKRAADQPASKMYYKPGQKITLDTALKLLLVKSANDVAFALGEHISGSSERFVQRMNQEAKRLGMFSTNFINPHGLPGAGQYTTARDMAVLALITKREFPDQSHYFSLEGVTTGKKNYGNFNMLIGRFDGADGMKTGFICASGFNQVSSARRNGRNVVTVVLGADSLVGRTEQSAELLQKGLTAPKNSGVSLASLAPYGDTNSVADVSKQICNPAAAKVRSEGRDDAGRMIINSPYIRELNRPLEYSFAGTIPGTDPVPQVKNAKPGRGEIANVPIPIPRPSF
jgi:D-alanyl-D-alanine carboxypeptidase